MSEKLDPRAQLAAAVSEEDIQRQIIEGFEAWGYKVLQTTVRVRRTLACECGTRHDVTKCPRCGKAHRIKYGATEGVPDLLVTRASYPPACWIGIEVKGPVTKISAAQAELQSQGYIVIARSFDEAFKEVRAIEAELDRRGKL